MTNEPKELEMVLAEFDKYLDDNGLLKGYFWGNLKSFLTQSIRSTEARMTERFREAIEAERGRFIGIYERRNAIKRQSGMIQDSSFESFDFNIFADNILKSLPTEEER